MHTVFAIGPADGGVADAFSGSLRALRRRGWNVTAVRPADTGNSAATGLRTIWSQRRTLRRAHAVHVEFGSNNLGAFWCALLATVLRRDVVVVAHDPARMAHAPGAGLLTREGTWRLRIGYRILSPLLDRRLIAMVMARAGAVVVLGDGVVGTWTERARRPIVRAPHIPIDPADPSLRPSECDYVLFAGFIGPHKGLDVLLRAWSTLPSDQRMRLVIAGDAGRDHEPWLNQLRAGAENLEPAPQWLGATEDERDFQRLFDRAAIVAVPYRSSSPASGILVRAMSAGRCIVATRVPAALHALEHDRSAVLVDVDDVSELGRQLGRLTADGAERDRLGAAAARRAAELFDSDRFAASLEHAYAAARGTDRGGER
jgi:glycosyltransferase involved in cell wall biosynthesis